MIASRLIAVAAAFAVVRAASAADGPVMAGHLESGDRVAVLGDSITEQRNYSVNIEEYLLACQPASKVQTAQFGWSGETTWGFLPRMTQDALWFHPTVATIAYGMNDGGYGKVDPHRLAEYTDKTTQIVKGLKAAGCRLVVVGGPGPVDRDAFHHSTEQAAEYNATLATFAAAARKVAVDQGVAYADLNGVMAAAMVTYKRQHPDHSFVGGDGVHPDNLGHLVMAYALLKAMGCDGDIGTITMDLAADSATATPGQQVTAMTAGQATVTSTRWPFYVHRDGDPIGAEAALTCVPFMADLNRYMLVVKNPPAGKRLRVTWAEIVTTRVRRASVTVSKSFDAAELAKGVNLADQFPTTPFAPAWAGLDAAVHAQQEFETPLNKRLLHDETAMASQVRAAASVVHDMARAAERFDGQLRQVSAAMVTPVTFTLKVEAE